jgi:hypothetical protein
MAKGVLDIYLIYEFLRRLVTPFDKWKAYQVGLIDKDGKVIVDKDDRTDEQNKAWGYYDRLIANLKKLLGKIPGGKSQIASFAAALLLLREHNIDPDDVEYLEECINFYMKEARQILTEDAPTNIVGDGHIAGLGIGPQGEPGFAQKVVDRHRKKNKKKAQEIMAMLSRMKSGTQ